MTISPYFRNLRSAYFAEMDDLMSDSEGKHVLASRLTQRRKELGFLVSMMEISPEMVTVVLHKAFKFKSVAAMDQLVAQEPEDMPEWDGLANALDIAPWAHPLIETIRKQAMGDWFLAVAAGLEYLYDKPDTARASASHEDDEQEEDDLVTDADDLDDDEEREARAREEAGADWMVEQGFDRKD
ncbi:MAG: hypothetical protein CFE44_13940 [Burkholderiales bacterium PBB4]|nr:MAG: hypothetical protein CFE44_13940 [Burkholderiales bacterium PBB4]